MSFSPSTVILAVPPADLVNIATVRETYGALLPIRSADPDSVVITTLLGHRDRNDSPDLRAGVFDESVTSLPLTDGRIAFVDGFLTTAFLAALDADPLLANCEILSTEDLAALLPVD